MKLNEEQFKELLKQARNGNQIAISHFIEHNTPVAKYTIDMLHLAGKYLNYTKDELMGMAIFAIYKSISTYNDTNNYNNHLIYLIRSEIKNYNTTNGSIVKQPRKEDKITYTDEFKNEPYDDIDSLQTKDDIRHLKEVLSSYMNKLTDNERNVLKSLYFDELSNRETAIQLKLSDAYVSNLHRAGLIKLRKLMM